MASVPNLPIAPAVPTPGTAGAPDADGAALDLFAQLLSGGPLVVSITGQDAAQVDEMTLRAAPGDGEDDSDGETPDIIPLLQAQSGFPVAVVPAATPETQPVATGGAKLQTQAAADAPALKPAAEETAGAELVGAAVKAAVDKLAGKPQVRVGKPGRAEPATADAGKPVDQAAAAAQPRSAELLVPRVEVAVQPTAPVADAVASAPVSPQPVSVDSTQTKNVAPAVADLVAERTLNIANDNQWLDRLARDIARSGAGDEPLRFRLHPQTLGHLQVEVTQGDRGASVRLTVETEAARNILIDAQPRLAAEARAQGIRLAGTEVDLGTASQQGGDARRNGEAQPHNIVRVVRGTESSSTESGSAESRSDRYA